MDEMLPLRDGVVVISGSSASGTVLADQLVRCTANGTITITAATRVEAGNVVTVEGYAAFLRVTNARARVVATQGANGVTLTASFTLIQGASTTGSWRFSDSFPNLPTFLSGQRPDKAVNVETSLPNTLDTLNFADAAFVLNTDPAAVDEVTGAPLVPGLNFVARLLPPSQMGILASILIANARIPVHGTVLLPRLGDAPLPPYPPMEVHYPWDYASTPGILLRADLPLDLKVGSALHLFDGALRVYCPIDDAAMQRNPQLTPRLAATAELDIPSAGVKALLTANGIFSAKGLSFGANVQGATLTKLDRLVDLVGGGNLAASLPDDIKDAAAKLGNLGLTAVSLDFAAGWKPSAVGATVTLPGLNSKVLPGFELDALSASFMVSDPFGPNRALSAELGAQVEFLGAPLQLSLQLPELFADARTLNTVYIPVSKLLEKLGIEAPALPDLPINQFGLQVAKDGSYAVNAVIAQAPPWTIDLGPTNITIKNVLLSTTRSQGGAATGLVAGGISLGDEVDFEVLYQIPGPLVLKAEIPFTNLKQIANKIADVANLPMPADFPDIELVDSLVEFVRDTSTAGGTTYDFMLRTTVAIGSVEGFTLAALLLKNPVGTGFAAGIWTPQWAEGAGWSPSMLWKPLSALTIDSAGLVFSSIAPDATQRMQILPASAVPAIAQSRFTLLAGVSFFATLTLKTGQISVLSQIFGDQTTFSLFASLGLNGDTLLIAHLGITYERSAFTFDGFDLAWQSTGTSSAVISATASGSIQIDTDVLTYAVTGAVSTDGLVSLRFNVRDWVHPFGYQRLTIKNFGFALAAGEVGVTIALQGTFEFTTAANKSFSLAVAGAITDFEAPTALAFALQSDSPGQSLKISEVLEGITTIDIYNLPKGANLVPWIAEIKLLDLFLEIRELSFWVVVVDQVEIVGVIYKKGFGFRGDISLFGKPVRLYVELREAERSFAGSAEFPEEIALGNVLVLARPASIPIDSKQDLATGGGALALGKGPALSVSSFIDAQHPQYFFVGAHVALLDIVTADIFGEATNDGIVYSFDLSVGHSGSGAWAAQKIEILVSREKLSFGCSIAYEFGLQGVTLGGFDLFGGLRVPAISLPNFHLSVRGDVGASLLPPKFHLGGAISFSFMGEEFDPSFAVDVDLASAPAKLGDFGALLLAWIEEHLKELLESALSLANKFADWVKANFERFKDAIEQVVEVLKKEFDVVRDVADGLLQGIGYAASEIEKAVDEAYQFVRESCAATQAMLAL